MGEKCNVLLTEILAGTIKTCRIKEKFHCAVGMVK
jgi:hypothetical protein